MNLSERQGAATFASLQRERDEKIKDLNENDDVD